MYKLNFLKKKFDILLLDEGQVDLKFKNCSYYSVDFKSLNIFVLINSLLKYFTNNKQKKLSFKELYKQNLYRFFSPKVIISHHLNNRSFEAKFLCPEIISMTYQFGFTNKYAKYLKNRPKKYCSTDYFFVFHEIDKKILEKYFNCNFIITGSVRNNAVILKKRINKKYFLTYISEYKKKPDYYNNKNYNYQKFVYDYQTNTELTILKILKNICNQNGRKLAIALRSNRRDKHDKLSRNEEINYYKKILGYQPEIGFDENSYEIANNSELNICLSSNLGIELLARGLKVFYINIFSNFNKAQSIPYFCNDNNPLIHSESDSKAIEQKVINLLKLNSQELENLISKNIIKIVFDPDNQIIKNKINEIINK